MKMLNAVNEENFVTDINIFDVRKRVWSAFTSVVHGAAPSARSTFGVAAVSANKLLLYGGLDWGKEPLPSRFEAD